MPTVDVMTGAASGEIKVNTQFEWNCPEAAQGTSITVTAQIMPNGNPWFSPSPTPAFVAKTGSVTVTANGVGSWSWLATGVVVAGGARVHIVTIEPMRKAG